MWWQWAWLGRSIVLRNENADVTRLSSLVCSEWPRQINEPMAAARPHPRTKCFAGEECSKLLLSESYRLKQFEIERRLRSKRDVAVAGQTGTTGTRGGSDQRADSRAFAATSNCSDGCATSRATTHHGRRALAFSFAGHGCAGGLNLMILAVDCDAGELESQRSAAFETACSFRVSHDSLGARALGNGDLAFDFNGRFDCRRELVAGFVGFRADGLIQNDGNHGVSRDDQRLRLDDLFHGGLFRGRHGRSLAGGRAFGLPRRRLLTTSH